MSAAMSTAASAPAARPRAPRARALRFFFVALFPLLVIAVYILWIDRQGFVESRRCVYAALAAYLPLLWGSIRFMFGWKGRPGGHPRDIGPPFVLAAVILLATFDSTAKLPANRTPTGWSPKIPHYPGALLHQESCAADECAAQFQLVRAKTEGARHVERYDVALIAAKLPAQGWPASCPSLGDKCRIYNVAGLRLIECLEEKHGTVNVRYGPQPCPDGESEQDAGTSY